MLLSQLSGYILGSNSADSGIAGFVYYSVAIPLCTHSRFPDISLKLSSYLTEKEIGYLEIHETHCSLVTMLCQGTPKPSCLTVTLYPWTNLSRSMSPTPNTFLVSDNNYSTFCYVFIAVLVMIAKIWNQPKYPSNDEQLKKMCVYIFNGILLSIKQNDTLSFVAHG